MDNNRIAIFYTQENLKKLCMSKVWFVDATFKVVPQGFEQLLIIQTIIEDKKYPLLYALMKRKNEESYNKIFLIIKENIKIINVEWIIVDFEMALCNSCAKNFENAKIRGCWFHFNQIFFRKLIELGCKVLFRQSSLFRTHCHLIAGLAFVPSNMIQDEYENLKFYFDHLSTVNPNIINIMNWFKNNFIVNTVGLNHI